MSRLVTTVCISPGQRVRQGCIYMRDRRKHHSKSLIGPKYMHYVMSGMAGAILLVQKLQVIRTTTLRSKDPVEQGPI